MIRRIIQLVLVYLTASLVSAGPLTSTFGSTDRSLLRPSLWKTPRQWIQQRHSKRSDSSSVCAILRGGGPTQTKLLQNKGGDDDDERYSRQVYTLGARAHRLVRTATIYLDGPLESGLVYECAKNLALSGLGNIVLLVSDTDTKDNTGTDLVEDRYHKSDWDDLGQAYHRAARTELGYDDGRENEVSSAHVLMEFIQRLNPSVHVSILPRSDLLEQTSMSTRKKDSAGEQRAVLLAVDRPLSSQLRLNDFCRHTQMAFVAVETAGVYGRTFCDFGPSFEVFDADGETPLVSPLDRVEWVNDEASNEASNYDLRVHIMEGEKHDVSKGDTVQFQLKNGDAFATTCTVVQVETPRQFTVQVTEKDVTKIPQFYETLNKDAVSLSRVKIPYQISFLSLREALESAKTDDSVFTPCDLDKSFDLVRRNALMSCFQGLETFVTQQERLPEKRDMKRFRRVAHAGIDDADEIVETKEWKSIVRSFCKTCAGKLTPIQAILGAIASQEVLKAVSGLYTPIQQFLLYDCDELLVPRDKEDEEQVRHATTGQSYILGQRLCDSLAEKRLFVVGAGAIGCELLKNLAAMNAATTSGCVTLTDMDTIEKSNLSRQLLFRDADIGKFKSAAAKDAVARFNPSVQIESHTAKVGEHDHGPFGNKFWSRRVEIVLNALDNMEARLYIDGQCVANEKGMIDAGTLGSKGNVQVVVPHQSESYGSSVDPPDPAIPVCTLKNFPYAISHTIQWGRDLFEGYFERRPKQAKDWADLLSTRSVDEWSSKIEHDLGEEASRKVVRELYEDWEASGVVAGSSIEQFREACVRWAARAASELFDQAIQELLEKHPVESLDEEGDPFWVGTRRVPKALKFEKSNQEDSQQAAVNENLIAFVQTAARLRMEIFVSGGESADMTYFSADEAVSALESCQGMPGASSDTLNVLSKVSSASEKAHKMQVSEFEKDDDANGHVAFVTAASNLRALNYGIAPVDAMETRRVAGRIVPAMISTTAFVSALSCVELLKLVQKSELRRHRNAFVNLALPFFAYTVPLPAESTPGLGGRSYSLWDKIVVREKKASASTGGLCLSNFLRRVAKKAGPNPELITVSSVSYGPYMIYANFLHEDDDEILQKPLKELIREAIEIGADEDFLGRDEQSSALDVNQQLQVLERGQFIDLTVVVEDQTNGDEVELPPVRLEWQIAKK